MRQNLIKTFDEIYVLNLHGNAKRRERAPNGTPDENVFDIRQGVAIVLLVKQGEISVRKSAAHQPDASARAHAARPSLTRRVGVPSIPARSYGLVLPTAQ